MNHATLDSMNLVDELRARLQGEVITADQPGYDDARRVWNGMFDDRSPLAVIRCAGADDVRVAVQQVGEAGLPLAVRGGGHHIAGFGTCDQGFVLDLGALRGVRTSQDGGLAHVQGGATLHDVDTATSKVGRAVPVGLVSPTGVGGLCLSGGIGWLTRLHGYTCDNLVAAEVVTAAGALVRATEHENADLLWGLRGGGGNFGIVTEFEFQTHPVETVEVAEAYHLIDDANEVADLLRFYRDWTEGLPRSATVWMVLERVNESHPLPEDTRGRRVLGIMGCDLDVAGGTESLGPMLRERSPAFARSTTMRHVDLQHSQDTSQTAERGLHCYMKGEMVTELTDRAIEGISSYAMELPTEASSFEIGQLGGALGDRDEGDAAVGLRNTRYLTGFGMMSRDGVDVDQHIAWTREAWSALVDASAGGVYLNFSGEDTEERVLGSLGAGRDADKRKRLVELKRRYDPSNMFRVNHNIDPAT